MYRDPDWVVAITVDVTDPALLFRTLVAPLDGRQGHR
jgi:hypothetical protein